MVGSILALLAAFSFSVGNIFLRRAVYRSGESFSPVPISAFIGMFFFGIILLISGKAEGLMPLSWLGLGSLAGAGILHFIIGRLAAFTGLRLIGVNRAVPIVTSNTLFASLLAVFFLGESLTIALVLAIVLVVSGVILLSTTGNVAPGKPGMYRGSLAKGMFAALGGALCWSVSPNLVKIGLNEVSSPLQANFISYTAASMVAGILLFHPRNSEKLRRLDRPSLLLIIISGIAQSVAHLCMYTALAHSPVSTVIPLTATQSLIIFPLSFLINRKMEAFHLRIIIGAIAIVAAVFLIFLAA